MKILISTDASYLREYKIAGFAFYIQTDAGVFARSGVFKNELSGSDEAELLCVINALHYLATLKLKNIHQIRILTDSLNVKSIIHKDVKSIKKFKLKDLRDRYIVRYDELLKRIGINEFSVSVKYVQAHVDGGSKENVLNNWCDMEAKRMLTIGVKSKS